MKRQVTILNLVVVVFTFFFGLSATLHADLLVHYTFDDNTTANTGSAGSVADGTLTNGASISDDPIRGKVLDCSGYPSPTPQYLNSGGARGAGQPPTWADVTNHTIAFWVGGLIQDDNNKQDRDGRNDRSTQDLIDRSIDDIFEISHRFLAGIFTDAVVEHDRIIDRVA